MAGLAQHRARPAEAPQPGQALARAREEQRRYVGARELLERISVVRGLLLLALLVMVSSVARAGLERVFVPGWWRQW